MTTPDAEVQRRLNQALRDHHGDVEAWTRLGDLLRARRQVLDPRYGNRRLFVRERGEPDDISENKTVNEKLVYDIEGGPRWGRKGFTAAKLAAVARAYDVTLDSVAAALDGGELEPAPARAPRQVRPAPPGGDGWLPPLDEGRLAGARPYADEIYRDLISWTARYVAARPGTDPQAVPDPPGAELFPDSREDAATWDLRADLMTVEERVWLIAALRSRQAAARSRGSGTGLGAGRHSRPDVTDWPQPRQRGYANRCYVRRLVIHGLGKVSGRCMMDAREPWGTVHRRADR